MTGNRCSACAAAGITLAFCSQACQRMASFTTSFPLPDASAHSSRGQVWKEHKRVCGPAANPFLWPLLTQQEAEDAVANKDFRVRDPDAPDFPSLSENLQDLGMSASIVDVRRTERVRPEDC